MKSVGIKNLKNNLSRYLDMVREGEVVYVTDRDEVIAELRRPAAPGAQPSRWDAFIDAQTRKGSLVRARRRARNSARELVRRERWPSDLDTAALYDDSRADRT